MLASCSSQLGVANTSQINNDKHLAHTLFLAWIVLTDFKNVCYLQIARRAKLCIEQ